jgi:hypothetical protein
MSTQHHTGISPDGLPENYPDNLIIDRPDLKSRPLIFGEQLLTLIFWGFWFYLWLPFISVLAWAFGFHIFYSHMIALGGFAGFLKQLNVFFGGIFSPRASLPCGVCITSSAMVPTADVQRCL